MRTFADQFFKYLFQLISLSLMIWSIAGCGGHLFHVVEPGETLYSVGWLYGYDYRDVAKWNGIPPPYIVNSGQRIRVAPPNRQSTNDNLLANKKNTGTSHVKVTAANADKIAVSTRELASPAKPNGNPIVQIVEQTPRQYGWQWPTQDARILQSFDVSDPARKGIDLAGYAGQPVRAAAPGRVVYSGGGLSRYGKLIIVKHDENFLSAYAHNRKLLVKQGDELQGGQKIAEMGNTGTNGVKLHFEIRRNGKPVNPLQYLPSNAR